MKSEVLMAVKMSGLLVEKPYELTGRHASVSEGHLMLKKKAV
jgi:hypothetical protein